MCALKAERMAKRGEPWCGSSLTVVRAVLKITTNLNTREYGHYCAETGTRTNKLLSSKECLGTELTSSLFWCSKCIIKLLWILVFLDVDTNQSDDHVLYFINSITRLQHNLFTTTAHVTISMWLGLNQYSST